MGGCEAVSRALEGVRGESGQECEAPSSAVWLNGEGVVRDGLGWVEVEERGRRWVRFFHNNI